MSKTRIVPWQTSEFQFLRANVDKGINWLVEHMGRSKGGIQRIAYIKGYPIANIRNANRIKAAKKEPEPFVSADDQAQENVKAIQAIQWPSKCHQTN